MSKQYKHAKPRKCAKLDKRVPGRKQTTRRRGRAAEPPLAVHGTDAERVGRVFFPLSVVMVTGLALTSTSCGDHAGPAAHYAGLALLMLAGGVAGYNSLRVRVAGQTLHTGKRPTQKKGRSRRADSA
jgi:hypothetical protein